MLERTIPGPNRAPRAPTAFTPLPRACDAHCHIFGPQAKFPFSADTTYVPPDSGLEEFEKLQERLGLSRAVFIQATCHGTDNSAMVDALIRSKGRYAGVAIIDESFADRQIEELHEVGVRGIRFNFVAHLGGAPETDVFWRLVRRVAKFNWHVIMHFDAKDLPTYARLLDHMPVPYVIDHLGRIDATKGVGQEPLQQLLALLRDERAWMKISGAERFTKDGVPPYDDVVPIAQAFIAAAPNRILWGTDWPHPNVRSMPDDGDLIDLLAKFAPDESVRNKILVENPQRLYDFSDS